MIPTIHWTYNKSKMIKDSICCYIYSGKPNILPTTFPRPSRKTTMILRLSRHQHHMKYYLINRINNFIHKRNNIHGYKIMLKVYSIPNDINIF